jgi:hypothetical protein
MRLRRLGFKKRLSKARKVKMHRHYFNEFSDISLMLIYNK